jgi:PAS domain S-box-containing protein
MDSVSSRERLYEVFADKDRAVEKKIDHALDIGTEYFALPIGFFTRVSDDHQKIVNAVGDHPLIQPGETCPLEDAYCRRTIEMEEVLAVQDVNVSPIPDRAVETFDLGTYIGTKIVVDDEVYGTVCFAAEDRRETPFSEAQTLFLELLGSLIGTVLERQRYEQRIEAQNERLRAEKQRFEGIAETSSDILFRVGTDQRFSYVSSAVEQILGYEPAELIDQPFLPYLTDAVAEKAITVYERLLDGEDVRGLTLDFLDDSGEIVVLEINATPITDDGDIVGAQGVGRDVTARQAQQRELRLKNRAIDEADVGVSIADPTQPDTPMIYVNEGFERLTGYSAVEAVGKNCRFLQGPDTDPEAVDRFRSAIENEAAVTVELLNYRTDGTPFWNRVQLSPVFKDGELSQYLGFQTDTTERRRTEQLIELLNRVLRHNLRNGMSVVSGSAEIIQTGDQERALEAGRRLERISEQLIGLSEQAREIERYARLDREPQRLDPAELFDSLTSGHREQWSEARLSLQIDTDRDLCAGWELEQALSELLDNAVKHNSKTAPKVEITVREAGEWIEIVVVDDGPGISEMERTTVNTGSETALEHGSGLGLWLINWIVTRYGGSFQLTTRDGDDTGTVGTIRLPAIGPDQSVEDAERGPTVLFR